MPTSRGLERDRSVETTRIALLYRPDETIGLELRAGEARSPTRKMALVFRFEESLGERARVILSLNIFYVAFASTRRTSRDDAISGRARKARGRPSISRFVPSFLHDGRTLYQFCHLSFRKAKDIEIRFIDDKGVSVSITGHISSQSFYLSSKRARARARAREIIGEKEQSQSRKKAVSRFKKRAS